MFKLIKRLFEGGEKMTVYKYGKTYKFRSYEKAIAFMLMG